MDYTFIKMILILAVTVAQAQMPQAGSLCQGTISIPSADPIIIFFACHALKKLGGAMVKDTLP